MFVMAGYSMMDGYSAFTEYDGAGDLETMDAGGTRWVRARKKQIVFFQNSLFTTRYKNKEVNVKLYYTKAACSLVVRIILNELGCSFQDESVDLRAKKTAQGEDYWKINPKGSVPALLLDNGQVLTENQVILQYLSDTTPGQRLIAPPGDFKRYRTLEWLNYISTELHKSISQFYNPNFPEEVKTNLLTPIILNRFKYINQQLAKTSFLSGEDFSLPDAYLFVMVLWANYFKMDLSSCTHILAYIETLRKRPSIVRSLQQEGIV